MKQASIILISLLLLGAITPGDAPRWQYAEVVENTTYTLGGARTTAVAHFATDSTLMAFDGKEPVRWESGLDGLNYLGKQGWELVSVHSMETQKYRNITYTLKKGQ